MKIVINQKFISVVLLMVVVILAGYIGYDSISGYITAETYDAYSAGYQDGMEYAVDKFLESSEDCKPVMIQIGNETRSFVDMSCLMEPEA